MHRQLIIIFLVVIGEKSDFVIGKKTDFVGIVLVRFFLVVIGEKKEKSIVKNTIKKAKGIIVK